MTVNQSIQTLCKLVKHFVLSIARNAYTSSMMQRGYKYGIFDWWKSIVNKKNFANWKKL